jgi:large subunit ribosomal protein L2
MAVRKHKPTTPGRRGASVSTFDELTRSKPEKSLVAKGRNKAGRNTHGRITARHQGGGTKRRYRVVDFRRNKDGVPAKVAHVEGVQGDAPGGRVGDAPQLGVKLAPRVRLRP